VSKGVIMPTFGVMATRLVRSHEVVHLHLPQLDAAGVALRGRLLGRPRLLTYHCDLQLPSGGFNRAVNMAVHLMNDLAARLSDRVVTYTEDYGRHSPFLRRFAHKLEVVTPPVVLPEADGSARDRLASVWNPEGRRPVIGMATRLAAEKGVEVLLEALPRIEERHPGLLVLFAGQHEDVLGERAYRERLEPTLRRYQADGRWRFLGTLDPEGMAAFYPQLDLLVVPSLNSTESFGLVQIEAMMSGVPVVASNLPGVRQPVEVTGMGKIAAVGDAAALAEAVLEVLAGPERFRSGARLDPGGIRDRYSPARTAAEYESLFEGLLRARRATA
jgi:glycosyltransferase involved in cell wall biosynthesis